MNTFPSNSLTTPDNQLTEQFKSLVSKSKENSQNQNRYSYLEQIKNTLGKISQLTETHISLIRELNNSFINNRDFLTAIEIITYITKFTNLNDEQLADLIEIQTENCFNSANIDLAFEYAYKELDLRKNLSNPQKRSNAFNTVAVLQQVSGDIDNAYKNYLLALDGIKNIDSCPEEIQYIYAVANINQHYLGNHHEAIEYYQKGVDIALRSNDLSKVVFYLDHLGMTSISLGNYNQALDYFQESEKYPVTLTGDGKLFHTIEIVEAKIKLNDLHGAIQSFKRFFDSENEVLSNYTEKHDFGYVYLLLGRIIDDLQGGELSSDLKRILGYLDFPKIDPEDYFDKAIEFGRKSKQSKLMLIRANIQYAQYLLKRNKDSKRGLVALNEAKTDAKSKKYGPEMIQIQSICRSFNLDFDKPL
ncbi:MAG: tetratricopeptide repeat protein [Candidatus Hodarchaeales archaeon]|jgi:tetratricopeptide (TPR) repeat protein